LRILAIYIEHDEPEATKRLEIDVSREAGYWQFSRLLASAHLDEIRILGESLSAIGVARTLVIAGRFKKTRALGRPAPALRKVGDEAYPKSAPFIFINPRPDPDAFV
jgi:hypothetical protein